MELGRRGRKRRLGIEDEYWRLIVAGVGMVETCSWSGLAGRPGIAGARNGVDCRRCDGSSGTSRTATCRRWSGSGSRASAGKV